jgi:hypothetical protein
MAVAREAADPRAVPAHHEPEAIVLDLVNPERPGRRLTRASRNNMAGRDSAKN